MIDEKPRPRLTEYLAARRDVSRREGIFEHRLMLAERLIGNINDIVEAGNPPIDPIGDRICDLLGVYFDDLTRLGAEESDRGSKPKTRRRPRLVCIESPYHVHEPEGALRWQHQERNTDYLNACLADCFARGEAPYASHAIGPLCLDDDVPEQRRQGIEAGLAWGDLADARVVFTDLGVSPGMREAILRATQLGQTVEYRKLKGWGT